MIKIYELYNLFYENKKKINKIFNILVLIHEAYFLLTFLKSGLDVDIDILVEPWVYYGLYLLFIYLFHRWFGKYWILRLQTYQTKEFQKDIMPKNIKGVGKRGAGKDTFQSGTTSNFCASTKERIKDEIDEMKVHLFYFDLKKVNEYIKNNIRIFNVASKKKKKEKFMDLIVSENMFLKKQYENLYSEIFNDFKATGKSLSVATSKYIVSDSVNHKHIVGMLYDYMYLQWRLEIDIWILSNQPCFQYYDFKKKEYKMAKIYSPDLKATKKRKVKVIEGNKYAEYITLDYMIAEDWLCFWETEADVWWNNIDSDVRKNLEERGIRWYEVAQRHIMGEHTMSLRNGQVAGRTNKLQRDLEECFYSITRMVKVYGGSKRIFFIKLFMTIFFPLFIVFPKLKSKFTQYISQLKMSGWLKMEVVFCRTEQINYSAPGITLSTLLDDENSLYLNSYQTTLVFNIRSCWGKYNTHYLEYLGEKITEESNAALLDLPEWQIDMKLHEKEIIEMNYDTVDVFGIPEEKKYINNRKYKKVEKERKGIGLD